MSINNSLAQQSISIRPTNLYRNGYIINFSDGSGESVLLRDKITYVPDAGDTYHTVIQNERLDLIAYNEYRSKINRAAELWWVIADVNNIFNPLDLSSYVGKDLLIPNIQKVLLLIS